MTDTTVVDDPDNSRFVLRVGDAIAAFAEYRDEGAAREFFHTVTEPDFRGRGLARTLVEHALDDAEHRGLRVVPTCEYVAKVVSGEPRYQALVDG
ncbi:N-acetyltransferase [Rhodococcus rhodnii]|uniref:Acetyltransferase n=2 Tax=Rhodococcus rhodnii TaxID=38312 RepID=R7WI62_9NOCA|nr:GNAT family N-acetyltransferase [Rhodococcus rhodnii]EOM74877.1 acetyltransferase [Rhodococcus rhodnii LMG 5362]TXG91672.1 N-acetyltransferase [Rhodococcus rhodnii]